ncbi:hypothetical protein DFH07DRAFT_954634 [Mycena maculata]|uniref:Uncharacterized protein n=1 Tax=Mycena maculata TaxID=230809 RepID=A0AAD7NNX1_9AGAR|nr:hypothetical protein DFH07DRAFT_954634 [Mycena maculata]
MIITTQGIPEYTCQHPYSADYLPTPTSGRYYVDLPASPTPSTDEFEDEHTSELEQDNQRYTDTPFRINFLSLLSIVWAYRWKHSRLQPRHPNHQSGTSRLPLPTLPPTQPIVVAPITYKSLGINRPEFHSKAEEEAWINCAIEGFTRIYQAWQPKHGESVMFIVLTPSKKLRRALTKPDESLAPGHIAHCYGDLQGDWRVTRHYFVHKQQVYNVWRDNERRRTTHVEVLCSQVKLEMRWEDRARVTMWGLVKGRSFRPADCKDTRKKDKTVEEAVI